MTRLKRIRGPKLLTDKVSIVREMGRKYKNAKILVTIRLDPTQLKNILKVTSVNKEIEKSDETTIEKNSNAETLPPTSSELPEPTAPENLDTGEDISDSDISSMDNELTEFLTEHSVLVTPGLPSVPNHPEIAHTTKKPLEKKPSPKPSSLLLKKRQGSSSSDIPRVDETYKVLPRNVSPIVRNELHSIEDEFAPVDRMVFSLKDPLGGGRISLPVKSTSCIHFQCFDYENFCLFNKITAATKEITRRNLVQLNRAHLARVQQQVNQQPTTNSSFQFSPRNSQLPNKGNNPNISNKLPVALPGSNGIHNFLVLPTFHSNFALNNPINNNNIYNSNGGYSQSGDITSFHNQLGEPYIRIINDPKPRVGSRFVTPHHKYPMYKCPICDTQFPLSELSISDGFNFFIRATPKEIDRVELLIGLDKYRLIDDNRRTPAAAGENNQQSAEVIVLTSDEEDEDDRNTPLVQAPEVKTKKRFDFYERAQEILNQTTDNEIHYGDGESWDDPIVLD